MTEQRLFSNQRLIRLIIPLVIEQALTILVGMCDGVMVSSVGEAAISGVSLVDMINNVILVLFAALATGGAVVTSQFLGARQGEKARQSAGQLVLMSAVLGVAALEEEIEDLEDTLKKPARIRKIIVGELEDVRKKYAQPRKTEIIYSHEVEYEEEPEDTPDYPVTLFLSREGYFKKITPQSLRMSGEQKFKEGDGLFRQVEATNNTELMFFTDRQQVYKVRAADFADSKASVLGDYLPTKLGMDEDEKVIDMVLPGDYSGHLLFFFENGKCARVALSAYATTSNRRKLTGAYSDKSPLTALLHLTEDKELALISTEPRALLLHTSLLSPKTTRATQGVAVMNMKPRYRLQRVCDFADSGIVNLSRYRVRSIPAAGALLREEDQGREQMTLL